MQLHGYRNICSPLNKSGLGFCSLFLRSPGLCRPWSLLVVLRAQITSEISYTHTHTVLLHRIWLDTHHMWSSQCWHCISRWADCIFAGRPSWAKLWEASLLSLLSPCLLQSASSGCRIYRDHGKNFNKQINMAVSGWQSWSVDVPNYRCRPLGLLHRFPGQSDCAFIGWRVMKQILVKIREHK